MLFLFRPYTLINDDDSVTASNKSGLISSTSSAAAAGTLATKTLSAEVQAVLGTTARMWTDATPGHLAFNTATTVNYTFEDVSWGNSANYGGETRFDAAREAAAEAAMNLWSSVANITFVETAAASAEIAYATYNLPQGVGGEAGNVFYQDGSMYRAEVRMIPTGTFNNGDYNFLSMIHEVGHAIGLKHPGNYNAGGGGTPKPYLSTPLDNHGNTVMSYTTAPQETAAGKYASTPMIYDIAAVQALYGANHSYNSGANTYALTSAAKVWTRWDGGGTDTLDASSYGSGATVDLREGAGCFSIVGQNYSLNAFGANIENAIGGAGADTIYGNNLNNVLTGGNGSDSYVVSNLAGGTDIVNDSGVGDSLKFNNGKALVTLTGNAVNLGNNDYTLTVGKDVFSLHLDGTTLDVSTGTKLKAGEVATHVQLTNFNSGDYGISLGGLNLVNGTSGNDKLAGADKGDSITGGAGADTLDGGKAGSDVLYGGAGNDVLVTTGINSALYGEGDNDMLTAKGAGSTLDGGAGNDTLVGSAGVDTLIGNSGIDSITGGAGGDIIILGADGAVDKVIYTSAKDAAVAGANTGYDEVTGFEANSDKFIFSGFKAAWDDGVNLKDGQVNFTTNAAANFNTTTEGLIVNTNLADSALTASGFASVLSAINALGITAAAKADGVIIVHGADHTDIFAYLEASNANQVDLGELTLLAHVNGSVGAADIGL